jgi:hypothetical protein
MTRVTWEQVEHVIQRHRIIYGVIVALLIALMLTVVSMALYVSSGASRLDLSRPGYESLRSDVQQGPQEDVFSSTGPLNSDVAQDFQTRFNHHRETLSKLDTFGTNALDDDQLQITPDSKQ